MDAKSFLRTQEETLIDRSSQILARMFATLDGQQLLQTEDGKQYLQITTRDLPVVRALLHLASDDEASSQTNALLVVRQEPEEVPSQASLVQGDNTVEAEKAQHPLTAVGELPKRKSIADIIAEVLQDAPHHILTVDGIIAATKERGVEVKRDTLRYLLSAKDEFHPVKKGSGRWTLKPFATKATAKPKPPAKTSLPITALAAELKDFFKENEFTGQSQVATIDAIWNRFVEVNRPEVFVDLQTAVWLCQWVGNPVGGNDVRKQKQNVSKLLRMNEHFTRSEDGYYGLKGSLPNIPRSNPTFDFESEEI